MQVTRSEKVDDSEDQPSTRVNEYVNFLESLLIIVPFYIVSFMLSKNYQFSHPRTQIDKKKLLPEVQFLKALDIFFSVITIQREYP